MWTLDTLESVGVLAASSAALAATQLASGTQLSAYSSLIVPAVSAIVAVAMSYAVMQTSQKRMADDLKDMRADVKALVDAVHRTDLNNAKIDGRVSALERQADA